MSEPRQVLEEYSLQKLLKSGPQSTVFLAVQPSTSQEVVIKLVNPVAPGLVESNGQRFLKQMSVLQSMHLQGVPEVLDYGLTPDENGFLVLARVPGVSGDPVQALPPERAVSVLLDVLTTVSALTRAGIVLGNLSPDNVLVSEHGRSARATVVGIGTLAYRGPGSFEDLEESLPELSTYVAPELLAPPDPAVEPSPISDLYSLAHLACHLLRAEVQGADHGNPEVRLAAERLGEAGPLTEVLQNALAPKPEDRTVSFSELRDALIRALPPMPAAGTSEAATRVAPQREAPVAAASPRPPAVAVPEPGLAGPDHDLDDEPTVVSPPRPAPPPQPPQSAPAPRGKAGGPPDLPAAAVAGAPAAPAAAPAERRQAARQRTAPPPPPEARPVEGAPVRARRLSPRLLLTVGAAVVVVVVVGVALLGRGPETGPRPVAQGAALRPTPISSPTPQPEPSDEAQPAMHPLLESANLLLMEGHADRARSVLMSLPAEDIEGFSMAESELYQELVTVLKGSDRGEASADLDRGLEKADIKLLRQAVAALEALPPGAASSDPGLGARLGRAKEALRLYSILLRAKQADKHLQVVEAAAAFNAKLPGSREVQSWREQAAEAIEKEAEEAIARGQFSQASATLEALREKWPERRGLADRIAWCRSQLEAERRFEDLLQSALAKAQQRRPDEGLRLLEGVTPTAPFEKRFRDARVLMEAQLAGMDSRAPAITLREGLDLEYKKDEAVAVPFRVVDDLAVVSVRAMLRTESSTQYREVTVTHGGGNEYSFTVAPALHKNELVEFYVTATDRTGHEGTLGSSSQPLQLKRKKWFRR